MCIYSKNETMPYLRLRKPDVSYLTALWMSAGTETMYLIQFNAFIDAVNVLLKISNLASNS